MTDHADLARKPAPRPATAADDARFGAAPAVAQLARTAQALNAGPSVVAQRALADRMSAPRGAAARSAAGAPAQLARIAVGYDRVGSANNLADSLVTSGLGNCIAVAAQDANTHRAVMGHLDTNGRWDDVGALTAFRTLLVNELTRVAGAAPAPVFHVSLGAMWLNKNGAPGNLGFDMRHTLILNCIAVFGTEPHQAGSVAEFHLGTGEITGSAAFGEEENLVAPPNNDPHGQAGDAIPYDRLHRGNVRGHKLEKNMSLLDKASVAVNPG